MKETIQETTKETVKYYLENQQPNILDENKCKAVIELLTESNRLYSYLKLQGEKVTRLDHLEAPGIQLPNSNLSHFVFFKCNLEGSNLEGTNCTGTNFGESNLKRGNFHRANLTGADLTGVDIQDADFTEANITDVKGIDPNDKQFEHAIKGQWSQKETEKKNQIKKLEINYN